MKDFYDIYYLASTFDFNGETLYEAIKSTVKNRGTVLYVDTFERIGSLKNSDIVLKRWSIFQKKYAIELSFDDAILFLEKFLKELLLAIANGNQYTGNWKSKEQRW